jgi:RimJ/RimL family protein N-acetyltransferase
VLKAGKLEYLWERMRQFPQVFDDVIPRTFEAFKESMLSPMNQFYEFVQGEDVIGLAAATQVRPRLDASMHVLFFDRRLRGREGVLKEALRDFAKRAQLRRMTVVLPEDNRTAIKLTLRLGFKPEGVMRKAHLRDGIYRDYHIFGILREELFEHLDSDERRPETAVPDGSTIRGDVRGGIDEVRPDSVHDEDALVYEPAGGNGPMCS